MKLNSRDSLETGSKLIQEFGSWSAVLERSKPNKNGVMVLQVERKSEASRTDRPREVPKTAQR